MIAIRRILLPVALGLLALGCAQSRRAPDFTPAAGEKGNVLVYLSNQSQARPMVTLAVYVDGRLAAQRTLGQDIHEHVAVPLRLPRGAHEIRVMAEGQVAQSTTEVVVGTGTTYVDASYYWSPGGRYGIRIPEKISIAVQDTPFGFR